MEPRINLHELSDDELRYLIGAAENEHSRRQIKRKGELWEAVVDAIKEYCYEFGPITIEEETITLKIKSEIGLKNPGCIMIVE